MQKRLFKLKIRLINDERVDNIVVESQSIATLSKELHGYQITFIPNMRADFDSFTLYTQQILRIDYEILGSAMFDTPTVYEIVAH